MEVNEDNGFASFVKGAMEAGLSFEGARVSELERLARAEARRRSSWRKSLSWGISALLAASLAVTVAVRVVLMPSAGSPIGEAIGLLCEMDGIEAGDIQEASDGALLLAWQEAPCVDLL